ncbi:MAG: AI-2E family transporter, partial [Rhodospirillales bacterium]|nr:AI-2E family transporter [Acetobacter sp.]
LLFFGLPPVISDIERFSGDLPQRVPQIVAKAKQVPLLNRFGLDDLARRGEAFATSLAGYLVGEAPKWLGHLFDLVTALILCIYFMLEGESAYLYFLSMVPLQSRNQLAKAMEISEVRMSKWLLGQGSLMLILGVSSTIVFALLHVRYFFLLGSLMGIFNIIPVVGGVITILLAAGAAALDSWSKMAGVLIFYLIYTQVENGYLTPRIMKTSVNLMGLTVLIALLMGTSLAGVVGALVSVPTAALVAVFIQEYLVKDDRQARELVVKSEKAME